MDILNNESKKEVVQAEGREPRFTYGEFDIDKLDPTKENFYSTKEIEELKDTIEMFGVLQDILVKETGDGRAKVIAGHRRRLAIKALVDEGKEEFRKVHCKIEMTVEDVKQKIMMIVTNSTIREFSSWEKVQQAAELKKYLKEYSKEHELPGRMRDYIAEALKVSKTTAGRLETTDKNLSDDFKEELKSDNISLSTAAELSRLSPADQKAVYEKTGGKPKLSDVKKTARETDLEHYDETLAKMGKAGIEDLEPCEQCEIARGGCKGCCKTCEDKCNIGQECRVDIKKREKENIDRRWYAVKTTMDILQKQIEKAASWKKIDEEEGNVEGAANRAAHIEYLGELLERAQKDIFELSGQDIFKGEAE